VVVVAMLLAADPAPSLGETESELKQARRQAPHRERRIIYNNDGDDITGWSSVTPAEYLAGAWHTWPVPR